MSRRHFPNNKIWANNASEITDPTSALWANAYESGEGKAPPEAGVHNYVFNRSDEQHQHIEQNGIPRWLTDTSYTDGGLALGSDNVIYQSQGAANQGNDPTTDDGTNWLPLPSVNLLFDPSGSTLTSENPEDAIKELDAKIEAFGPGAVIDTQIFSSPGSYSWNKPSGLSSEDTVLVRAWAGGGSGAATDLYQPPHATGGGGGGFIEFSQRSSDVSSGAPITVGSGASGVNSGTGDSTLGNDGQNSSFGSFVAVGGRGGELTESTGSSGFRVPLANKEFISEIYKSGGGEHNQDGGDAIYAGAGGGTRSYSPGVSWLGGNGGGTSGVDGVAGDSPGGGGGGGNSTQDDTSNTSNSGAGGDGRVEVYVIRGWSPSGITADIT